MSPLRLLLVGSDERTEQEVRRGLAAAGDDCDLTAVAAVEEAARQLQAHNIELVIVDGALSASQGASTIAALHAAADVPVVMLLASTHESAAAEAIQAGAQDYLVKGQFDGPLLSRVLRYSLERKRTSEIIQRLQREHSARVQAELEGRRARFLSQASQILASSLELETTLTAVANLIAQHLATACLVETTVPPAALCSSAVSPAAGGEATAAAWTAWWSQCNQPPHPRARALQQAESTLIAQDAARLLSSSSGTPPGEAYQRFVPESCIVVPLQARGQVLGCVTLLSDRSEGHFTTSSLELVEELAGRIALSVDNARLYAEAQAATRARDEVIAVVSHDLRNPLAVVSMAAFQVRRNVWDHEEVRVATVDKLERAVDRMNRLIEDLLDITRIDAGGLPLECERQAVEKLLSDACELLRPLAEDKAIQFEWSAEEGAPNVHADRHRVMQALSNLIGNALKFTAPHGTVSVLARAHDKEIVFSVQDTGPGIAPDHLPRLFDRFWQVHRGDRRGTGLGLAIAKGVVEAHGGRIWVESRVGVGSTFFFSLPLDVEAAKERRAC